MLPSKDAQLIADLAVTIRITQTVLLDLVTITQIKLNPLNHQECLILIETRPTHSAAHQLTFQTMIYHSKKFDRREIGWHNKEEADANVVK